MLGIILYDKISQKLCCILELKLEIHRLANQIDWIRHVKMSNDLAKHQQINHYFRTYLIYLCIKFSIWAIRYPIQWLSRTESNQKSFDCIVVWVLKYAIGIRNIYGDSCKLFIAFVKCELWILNRSQIFENRWQTPSPK